MAEREEGAGKEGEADEEDDWEAAADRDEDDWETSVAEFKALTVRAGEEEDEWEVTGSAAFGCGAFVSTLGARMRRSTILALCQQVECDYPFCFLGACGDELGRRVPCAGHFNGGRYYDFTRRCSEVLGGNNRWLDRCCRVDRDALKRDRVTLIVSLQSPLGASNHFGGRYRLWAVNYLWAGGGRNCAKPTTP